MPATKAKKKSAGRPRKKQLADYCNMTEAARRLGVSMDVIKALKKKGADGFRHHRVYPEDLHAWIAKNKEQYVELAASGESEGEKKAEMLRKLRAEADHIETKVAILKRDYVPFDEVRELIIAIVAKVKAQIYQFQVREAPALLRGLDADQIRTIQKRRFEQLCGLMMEVPETLDQIGKSRLEDAG